LPVASNARSFPDVSGLSRRQWSFSPSSSASVAGLRWIGPVRHFYSRCLFTHLTNQAARVNCLSAILVVAPFYESEQLGSRSRPSLLTSKPVSPLDWNSFSVRRIGRVRATELAHGFKPLVGCGCWLSKWVIGARRDGSGMVPTSGRESFHSGIWAGILPIMRRIPPRPRRGRGSHQWTSTSFQNAT